MRIAIIGDYDVTRPSHIATSECIRRTGNYLLRPIRTEWIATRPLEEKDYLTELLNFDGIWGAPGAHESHLGMVNAIQFSRENDIPYLGTWSGFQHALVEYAKNVLQVRDSENVADLFSRLITKMSCSLVSQRQEIHIHKGSLVSSIYGSDTVVESYNCSFSLDDALKAMFEGSGIQFTGTSIDGDVRIIEIPQCHFFIATLFQPQLHQENSFTHPLVVAFLKSLEG